MRPIKFRAWHEPTGLMYCGAEIRMTGDGNHEIWEGYNFEWLKNRAILMQSTGLHDKNGKEIFEGDIVRLTHKQRPKLLQVVFESGRFDHWETMDAFRLHTEVIGNIYQNPEPLK